MEKWKKDSRRDVVFVDMEELVPADHLLRKIERVMDYEWLYERLSPYYCHDNGRDGTDPVVLIKMVLIQHLFGIPALRQTHPEIIVNNAYRWFLGYSLLDKIPHFATVSYAFCKRCRACGERQERKKPFVSSSLETLHLPLVQADGTNCVCSLLSATQVARYAPSGIRAA